MHVRKEDSVLVNVRSAECSWCAVADDMCGHAHNERKVQLWHCTYAQTDVALSDISTSVSMLRKHTHHEQTRPNQTRAGR